MRLAVAVVGWVGREVVMTVRKQASEREREREREEREGASEHSAAGILSDTTECCDSLVSRGPVDLRDEPTQSA